MSSLRGIRGAISVKSNDAESILKATQVLLKAMVARNRVKVADIASVIFTVTDDLNAEFPAKAARRMGWKYTPLICAREIDVQGSIEMCVRVLMHVNTQTPQSKIKHVFLGNASKLRPDLR